MGCGTEDKLRAFIVEMLLDGEPEGDPLAADAIDSLGLQQLAEYIEEEFGVVLADREMVRKNFADVPTLAAFIASKEARAAL